MTPLAGQVALVTGASRGLGWALAREAARRDAHVLALARTVGALEELDDAIRAEGGAATLIPLDLLDHEGVARMTKAVAERWGRLDLWLHCAAQAPALSPIPQVDPKDFGKIWGPNVVATQILIGALAPLLRAAPAGRAVLMDDLREGEAFFGAYAASKAAARALWTAWDAESRRSALRAVLALPPPMATGIRGRFYPGEDRARLADRSAVARRLLDALAAGETRIDLRADG